MGRAPSLMIDSVGWACQALPIGAHLMRDRVNSERRFSRLAEASSVPMQIPWNSRPFSSETSG